MARKLLVVGLDSAPPRLVYEELGDELPTLSQLAEGGAVLRTTHPPITIPAWAVMVTGRTPGELGLYGFRHRRPGDYAGFYIANSRSVRARAVWDEVGARGMRSVVVGVPPSYPPRPVRGVMVSCFITPGPESSYTWPPSLKAELETRFGPYTFDVVYRSGDKDGVARDLWRMTRQHFEVYRYLAARVGWDFMMFVEIGVDRVHHAFWKYYDERHPRHVEHPQYSRVIPDYYRLVDGELGELLKAAPRDAVIMVVSDHGAKAMKGAFCVNQWLAEAGYLKLKSKPDRPGVELSEVPVDWSETVAWGWGGYYSRIFVNLRGREPRGVVSPDRYEEVLDDLRRDLESVRGPEGERWETRAFRPGELYPVVRGDAPDLMVYFDDLSWRAAGTLGWPSNYLPENDRGPDDAVHDWHGIVSVYDPEASYGVRGVVDIREVHDLMLEIMGVERG